MTRHPTTDRTAEDRLDERAGVLLDTLLAAAVPRRPVERRSTAARPGAFGDNRDHLQEWDRGDWRALDDLLALDGYRLEHCIHCDRYGDDSPDKHPSCSIVPVEAR